MVESCKLGKTECKCVGCKVKCDLEPEVAYCVDCDGTPVTLCTLRDKQ
jgi:hypothetical protein